MCKLAPVWPRCDVSCSCWANVTLTYVIRSLWQTPPEIPNKVITAFARTTLTTSWASFRLWAATTPQCWLPWWHAKRVAGNLHLVWMRGRPLVQISTGSPWLASCEGFFLWCFYNLTCCLVISAADQDNTVCFCFHLIAAQGFILINILIPVFAWAVVANEHGIFMKWHLKEMCPNVFVADLYRVALLISTQVRTDLHYVADSCRVEPTLVW